MAKHTTSGVHRLFGTSVLIVDANADAADLYAIWLRSVGHRVSIVTDASRALILAPVLRPSVVLIDMSSPLSGGIELAARLREIPELAECHSVALTVRDEAPTPLDCRAAGLAGFLERPVARAALLDSVFHVSQWDRLDGRG